MTDRRSFFARLTGIIAGLVASKRLAAEPENPLGTPITADDFKMWDAEGRQAGPLYEMPLKTSQQWAGGAWQGVTVNDRPINDVHSVEDYGYPHRSDGSFWGNVVSWSSTNDFDADAFMVDLNPMGFSEFKYIGWVKVGRWPEWVASSNEWVRGMELRGELDWPKDES